MMKMALAKESVIICGIAKVHAEATGNQETQGSVTNQYKLLSPLLKNEQFIT